MDIIKNTFTVSFFGHSRVNNSLEIEKKLSRLIRELIDEKEYVEFLVGRNGGFDQLAASCIRRTRRTARDDNSALVLVLPYGTAEYKNNRESFESYYDEIEICCDSAAAHFKAAIEVRNRHMIDRSGLVICYVKSSSGGAYKAMRYALKTGKKVINLCDI